MNRERISVNLGSSFMGINSTGCLIIILETNILYNDYRPIRGELPERRNFVDCNYYYQLAGKPAKKSGKKEENNSSVTIFLNVSSLASAQEIR